jgi:hypothetical protein
VLYQCVEGLLVLEDLQRLFESGLLLRWHENGRRSSVAGDHDVFVLSFEVVEQLTQSRPSLREWHLR